MKPRDLATAVRTLHKTYGARGALTRALFEARRVAHVLPARPSRVGGSADGNVLPQDWPLLVDAARVRAATDETVAICRANRVLGGEHHAYRSEWVARPTSAADWRRHPESGFVYDAGAPWYTIPHFDVRAGDIKDAWEPGRFAWAFDLARGWLLTGDDRYAAAFWQGLETFLLGAPPFRGVQWACGQETAIRAMAWLWAESALRDAPTSTADRRTLFRLALAWSAERIASAIGYAISQRNNHGISEAAALVALGARLRHAEPRAEQWMERGRVLLERLILDQFADDGWYAQHSFNYTRVALDQLIVAQRALVFAGESLSATAVARVRAAVRLMVSVIDGETGQMPNHGAVDGAYVLPLSTSEFRDFRPTLTAAAATFGEPLPSDVPADAETMAWLGVVDLPRCAPRQAMRLASGPSGWVSAASRGARVFARAGSYRTRPGHIDPLHVDVWIGGRAIAVDAGTYRYSAPAPWQNGLASMDVHNTVAVDGRPAAKRGPRFLWLSWPIARVLSAAAEPSTDGAVVELEHDSWRAHGVVHRRTCHLVADGAAMVDEIRTPSGEEVGITLHWLIDGAMSDLTVVCDAPHAIDHIVGDASSTRGWISERYAAKRPALSVRVTTKASGGITRIATGFGSLRSTDALRELLGASAGARARLGVAP